MEEEKSDEDVVGGRELRKYEYRGREPRAREPRRDDNEEGDEK